MSRSSKLVAALASAALVSAAAGTVGGAPAQGQEAEAAKPTVHTLVSGLLSPLSLAVADNGTRYFSQNFAGILMKQAPGQKKPKVIYANTDKFEVGAVSEQDGRLRFAISKNQRRGSIMAMGRMGKPYRIANIGAHEKKHNPDGGIAYGFRNLSAECAAQMPQEGPPPAYTGIVETHVYATELVGRKTYVADAAANAIFVVPRPGKVRTLAVLPPVGVTVTAEAAQQFGFPECVAGKKYWFEAVPTDIERGPGGMLYVSSLPGGPEDGSLGANARIYRVNPRNGNVMKVVGSGLISATGLDVARNGDIYVAELFRGRISKIKAGKSTPSTFVEVPLPADVEVSGGGVFATIKALPGENEPPAGEVVRIKR